MAQSKDLVALYDNLLTSFGLSIAQDGMISFPSPNGGIPVVCDGRRLVLPTRDVLRAANWADWIAFHPLCESIIRKESVVMRKLRAIINMRLTVVLSSLMTELIAIAADINTHGSLSPRQTELLALIPDVDAKTTKAVKAILPDIDIETQKAITDVVNAITPTKAADPNKAEHRLVNVYLKPGGHVGGKPFRRAAIVTFPILDEFENNEPSIFGVKMRKQDKAAIQALFTWILSGGGDGKDIPNYSVGSDNDIAPNFDALIRAYAGLSTRLNAVSWLFRKHLPTEANCHVDLSWVDDFKDLNVFKGQLPILSGNTGEGDGGEEDKPAVLAPPPNTALFTPPVSTGGGLAPPPAAPGMPMTAPEVEYPKIGAPMTGVTKAGTTVAPVSSDFAVSDWARTVAVKEAAAYQMPVFGAVGGMRPMYPQQPMQPMQPMYQTQMPYGQQPMQPQYPVFNQQRPMQANPQPMYPQYPSFAGQPAARTPNGFL